MFSVQEGYSRFFTRQSFPPSPSLPPWVVLLPVLQLNVVPRSPRPGSFIPARSHRRKFDETQSYYFPLSSSVHPPTAGYDAASLFSTSIRNSEALIFTTYSFVWHLRVFVHLVVPILISFPKTPDERHREKQRSTHFRWDPHDPRRRITGDPLHSSQNCIPPWDSWDDVGRFSGTLNVIMASASLRHESQRSDGSQAGERGSESFL